MFFGRLNSDLLLETSLNNLSMSMSSTDIKHTLFPLPCVRLTCVNIVTMRRANSVIVPTPLSKQKEMTIKIGQENAPLEINTVNVSCE